jgi:hypothetical protein
VIGQNAGVSRCYSACGGPCAEQPRGKGCSAYQGEMRSNSIEGQPRGTGCGAYQGEMRSNSIEGQPRGEDRGAYQGEGELNAVPPVAGSCEAAVVLIAVRGERILLSEG